jgi:hypothetical protein
MNVPNYFYLDARGHEIGPLSEPAIVQLHQAGTLGDDTLVRAENTTQWLAYCKVVTVVATSRVTTDAFNGNVVRERGPKAESNRQKRIKLFWPLYILAGLSFLLPFVHFSSLANIDLTGQQLIMGDGGQNIPAYQFPAVIVSFGLILGGLLFSLSSKRTAILVSGLFGVGAVIVLFIAKHTIENEIAQYPGKMVTVSFNDGFWLAIVFLVIAIIGQFKTLKK